MRTNLSGFVSAGVFIALSLSELFRPLRRSVESKLVRAVRNFSVAAVGGPVVALIETPVALGLSRIVHEHQWGLLNVLKLPLWLRIVLSVLLLDYTLYVWHVLTHKVPFLWRFHLVHHADLDLDASTVDSVTVVEWGQGLVERLADEHLEIRLDRRDDDVRTALLVPHGPGWEERLA